MRIVPPYPTLLAVALAASALPGATLGAQASSSSSASSSAAGAATVARLADSTAADSTVRDQDEVDAAGRRYAGAVRNCYQERGLKGDPSLSGLLRVDLTVLPAGSVQTAVSTATRVQGVGMPAVAECVATAARRWRFTDGAPRPARVILYFDLLPPDA